MFFLSKIRKGVLPVKRVAFVLSFVTVLIFCFYPQSKETSYHFQSTFCAYNDSWTDGMTLKIVAENPKLQPYLKFHSKNIFFHETSCRPDGIIDLNSRQSCAIESAARMNPGYEVFVLYASPVGFRNSTPLPLIDALLSYTNINFNYLNLDQYAEETPLADWMKNGELFRSKFVISHTSDILRYLSLWKYGGTYLDLDIVMLKPLNELEPNFAGIESADVVAVGIVNLEGKSGHEIANRCVEDLLKHFNGNVWGNNGPMVITRVLEEICHGKYFKRIARDMVAPNACKDFHVLPVEACYAIEGPDYRMFFEEKYLNETMKRLQNSIIAHVWNKFSEKTPLKTDANVAYIHLAKKYCPRVVEASHFF